MTKIIAISGSLRKHSYNSALLKAAADLAPEDAEIVVVPISDIPLYNGDLEDAQGIPPAVTRLKDLIAESDGLLIATPEYNQSFPGVLKNTMDWLTRPPKDAAKVFRARPVGVIGASSGMVGTRLGQTAWLPVLRALGTRPFFGRQLYVGPADKVFDSSGRLTDQDTARLLENYINDFIKFCADR